jgi:hypothetical protein
MPHHKLTIRQGKTPHVTQKDLHFDLLILKEPAGGSQKWVAQCLQYDIVAQANTLDELQHVFARLVATNVILALERGMEPLSNFRPAPQYYWDQYSKGQAYGETTPVSVPGDRIPKKLRNLTPRIPRGEATMRLAACV